MSPLTHILESLPVRLNKRYQWKSQDKVYNLKLYQSSVYLWIFSLTDSEAPIQSSGLMLTIITEKNGHWCMAWSTFIQNCTMNLYLYFIVSHMQIWSKLYRPRKC